MIWLLIHPYMIHPPTHPSDHHSLNHSYLNRSNILQPSHTNTHTHTFFSSSGKVRRCTSLCAGIAIRQKSHATQLQQFMKVNPNFEALLSALLCNLRPGTLKHRTVNDTRIQTIRCPPPLVIAWQIICPPFPGGFTVSTIASRSSHLLSVSETVWWYFRLGLVIGSHQNYSCILIACRFIWADIHQNLQNNPPTPRLILSWSAC